MQTAPIYIASRMYRCHRTIGFVGITDVRVSVRRVDDYWLPGAHQKSTLIPIIGR